MTLTTVFSSASYFHKFCELKKKKTLEDKVCIRERIAMNIKEKLLTGKMKIRLKQNCDSRKSDVRKRSRPRVLGGVLQF